MYEPFFGLKQRPFLITPDIDAYFSVNFMETSRQTIEETVHKGTGLSLVFGDAGTGKSLLMQMLRQTLSGGYPVALIANCRLETPKDLFQQLVHELSITLPAGNVADWGTVELRLKILDFVQRELTHGLVLLFDDAQHLSVSVLEEIRLLADVSGNDVSKDTVNLFRIVLAGTGDFEETLTFPHLEAFNQRVASRCYLDSFSGEETAQYVLRRIESVMLDSSHSASASLFTDEAVRRIHQLSGGVPRLINQLCEFSLRLAAERDSANVDGSLINDSWARFQHIEPVIDSVVQDNFMPLAQIEEIVDRKRTTFQVRPFNSVEFGVLSDSDSEPETPHRFVNTNEYKPPYPEFDDDEECSVEVEDDEPSVYRLPLTSPRVVMPKRECVHIRLSDHRQRFRRRLLLRKIRHRLGLFAGVLRRAELQQSEPPVEIEQSPPVSNEPDMNTQTLQEYGAAILEGRPPFVRKEPHYAYQTTETAPHEVTYPDPKTGVPIVLRWYAEKHEGSERFGVSYSEFLNKKSEYDSSRDAAPTESATLTPLHIPACSAPYVVCTSLSDSRCGEVTGSRFSSLDESFDESLEVVRTPISLAELFQFSSSSALQPIEDSAAFQGLEGAVRRRLESVILRIDRAAERIERAAEVSGRAGAHISQTAAYVESEVKAAMPVYSDLFNQWSEFQDMITSELESARERSCTPLKLQSFGRHQVLIERAVPTIEVEALFR